jgi:plasmid stabilization system protein ParE
LRKNSGGGTVYRVALADSAKADADAIYEYVTENSPQRGVEWFQDLMDCLYSLNRFPYRCPVAREARKVKREIRCLLFGKRRGIYRILYQVDEARRTVWILHIRHGARRDLKTRDLATPPEQ